MQEEQDELENLLTKNAILESSLVKPSAFDTSKSAKEIKAKAIPAAVSHPKLHVNKSNMSQQSLSKPPLKWSCQAKSDSLQWLEAELERHTKDDVRKSRDVQLH